MAGISLGPSASFAPVWRGSKDLQLGPVKWIYTTSKTTCKTKWTGPYDLCQSSKPKVGQQAVDVPSLYITEVACNELDASAGELLITFEGNKDYTVQAPDALGSAIFELDFASVERPLESHSLCGVLDPTRDPHGGKLRTWEDWPELSDDDYDDTGTGKGPWAGVNKWSRETYQQIKSSGQDSYTVYAPILKRTTVHLNPPSDVGQASGKLQFPPTGPFPDLEDWDWLAGADRCTANQRTFNRETEWAAAEYWDRLVYVTA